MVVQDMFLTLWSGKFPPNIMFCTKKRERGQGRLRMGTHGFALVQWGEFSQGGQKNKGKRGKNRCDQDMFCMCGQDRKKQVIDRDGRGRQRGYRWGIMGQ